MQKPAHWLYAEYYRKIRFELQNGKKITKPLCMNTGGRTFINVYWYESTDAGGPYLRLLDQHGEHLLDLQRAEAKVIMRCKPNDAGRVLSFAGPIKNKGDYGVTMYPDGIEATVDGEPAERLHGEIAESPGKYIGRIEEDGEGGLLFIRDASPRESMITPYFLEWHPLPWLQGRDKLDSRDPNR